MLTSPTFLLLLLPAFSLSATELLLEPSGGKAILVDTSLLVKRTPATTSVREQTVQTSQPSQDSLQVTLMLWSRSFTSIHLIGSYINIHVEI